MLSDGKSSGVPSDVQAARILSVFGVVCWAVFACICIFALDCTKFRNGSNKERSMIF